VERFDHCVPAWDSFAVVTGGVAGALVGLFFIAVSIRSEGIMTSFDLRNRAGQTVVDFGVVLLTAVLMTVPSQPPRVLGAELLAIGLGTGALLAWLEHRAESVDPVPLALLLKRVNANLVVAGGLVVTGVLLLVGAHWALYVVAATACFALVSGLTTAWFLLTRPPD
jgi:hypothetical protein